MSNESFPENPLDIVGELLKSIVKGEDDVLKRITEHAMMLTGAKYGSLVRVAKGQNKNYFERLWDSDKSIYTHRRVQDVSVGIIGRVARNGKAILIPDTNAPKWQNIYYSFYDDTCSELAIPYFLDNEVAGVINLESDNVNQFTEEHIETLKVFAEAVSIVLEIRNQSQEKQIADSLIKTLHKIDEAIIKRKPEVAIQEAMIATIELLKADKGDLYLYNYSNRSVQIYEARRIDGSIEMIPHEPIFSEQTQFPPEIKQGIIDSVARTREAKRTIGDAQDLTQNPDFKKTEGLDIHSEAAAPLLHTDGRVIGVINVESTEISFFTMLDLERLQTIATQLMIALEMVTVTNGFLQQTTRMASLLSTSEKLTQVNYGAIKTPSEKDGLTKVAQYMGEQLVISAHDNCEGSRAIFYHYDDMSKKLSPIAARNYDNSTALDDYASIILSNKDYWVLEDDSLRIIGNRQDANSNQENEHIFYDYDETINSLLIAPIMTKNGLLGVLTIANKRYAFFSNGNAPHNTGTDKTFIQNLVSQVKLAYERIERELREKEQRVLAEVGEAAYQIPHRLGNDLGPIQTYINFINDELVKQDLENAKITKNLERIKSAVRKVLERTSELKAEMSGSTEPVAQIRLREFVEEELKNDEQLQQVKYTVKLPEQVKDIPVKLRIKSVRDALQELIHNAIEAMNEVPTRESFLTIHIEALPKHIRFIIEDNGPGISEKLIPHIYTLFQTTKPTGSGFGLYRARRRIVQDGGWIELKTTEGIGTKFIVTLPKQVNDTPYEDDTTSSQ